MIGRHTLRADNVAGAVWVVPLGAAGGGIGYVLGLRRWAFWTTVRGLRWNGRTGGGSTDRWDVSILKGEGCECMRVWL